MPNPVVHFEIQSTAPWQSQKFFADLFDWDVNTANPIGYGLVEAQDGHGIGGGIGDSDDGQTRVTFYVEVDDLQAYLDKAEELGGETVVPVTVIPDMVTMAMFADPTGAIVGMVQSDAP